MRKLFFSRYLIVGAFYISNSLNKIFNSNQLDKVVTNNTSLSMLGIILLTATVLFIINKTLIWGTTILVIYMTSIVFIHMHKGKPFEVAMLILMTTIFATFLRKREKLSSRN